MSARTRRRGRNLRPGAVRPRTAACVGVATSPHAGWVGDQQMRSAPTDDDTIRRVLGMLTWAVVGWSPRPSRDSFRIAALLEARGKRVLRVNPNAPGALPDVAAAGP